MSMKFDEQLATAVTALAVAICRQPSVDPEKLQQDFISAATGLQNSQSLPYVAQTLLNAMDVATKHLRNTD